MTVSFLNLCHVQKSAPIVDVTVVVVTCFQFNVPLTMSVGVYCVVSDVMRSLRESSYRTYLVVV